MNTKQHALCKMAGYELIELDNAHQIDLPGRHDFISVFKNNNKIKRINFEDNMYPDLLKALEKAI